MRLADEARSILRSRCGDNATFAHLSKEGIAICDAVERRLNRSPSRSEIRDTVTMISRDAVARILAKVGKRK